MLMGVATVGWGATARWGGVGVIVGGGGGGQQGGGGAGGSSISKKIGGSSVSTGGGGGGGFGVHLGADGEGGSTVEGWGATARLGGWGQ